MVIKVILRSFELAFELRINFFKSKIRGIGINTEAVDQFSMILNYRHMKILFKCLGLPIGEIQGKTSFGKK